MTACSRRPVPAPATGSVPRWIYASAAGLVALIALAGCNPDSEGGPQTPPPPEVGVLELRPERIELTTELPGRVVPTRSAEVRPQVTGIITERLFEQGTQVEAGQILYRIDARPFRAAQARAEAELARAEAARHSAELREKRLTRLLDDNAVSRQDYDDAEAELRQREAEVVAAEAALDTARINLDYTNIQAPINGVVGPTLITIGALVTANQVQPLARITALDPIYVDLQKPIGALARMRRQLGDDAPTDVTLVLDDGSAYPHTGTLEVSDVTVSPGTGSVTLRAQFANPENILLPGMFVRARRVTEVRDQAILAPQQGIQRSPAGQAQAYVIGADGTAQQRTVEVSRAIGSRWLVEGGLQAGDRVIVTGTQRIGPGAPVRPVPWSPDDAQASPGSAGSAAESDNG